jgi:hypothetical protein
VKSDQSFRVGQQAFKTVKAERNALRAELCNHDSAARRFWFVTITASGFRRWAERTFQQRFETLICAGQARGKLMKLGGMAWKFWLLFYSRTNTTLRGDIHGIAFHFIPPVANAKTRRDFSAGKVYFGRENPGG